MSGSMADLYIFDVLLIGVSTEETIHFLLEGQREGWTPDHLLPNPIYAAAQRHAQEVRD